jgi:hypothetical protein
VNVVKLFVLLPVNVDRQSSFDIKDIIEGKKESMNYLSQMVAKMSDTMTEGINEDLFDRRTGKQIWEFIAEDLRSIEMLPDIFLRNIQYIRDPSKLDVRLNIKNIKNKKILKNKIEKLIPVQPDIFDAIRFTVDIAGGPKVENTILLPKYIDRYHFMISGNKTLAMFQVVDNATYNRKGEVILKSRIQQRLSREEKKKKYQLLDVETGKEFNISNLNVNLFKKNFNPLFYFAARRTILGTIDFFGYTKFLNLVTEVKQPDVFYYFRINSNILIEAEKTLFDDDAFFRTFAGMLAQLFNTRNKIDDIYEEDLWVKKLGSLFTSAAKNQLNKGYDVMKSFRNVLDYTTQNALRIDYKDKADIYCVLRWMMREFNELRNMDNNSLSNKRIRTNEYIAAYFGRYLKDRVNYALNLKPYDKQKLGRIFKMDEHILIKALFRGKKPSPLFRYNIDINDLQALNGLKFSLTGIQGLPSDKVKDEQRDIYPSHLGRFELNAISSSSPGISGMLTPFCKIYDGGYFGDSQAIEKPYVKKLRKRIKEIKINDQIYGVIKAHYKSLEEDHEKRRFNLKYRDLRNEKGFIQIVRPHYVRNEKGFIKIDKVINPASYIRSLKGYIKVNRNFVLVRLTTRIKPELRQGTYARNEKGFISITKTEGGLFDGK